MPKFFLDTEFSESMRKPIWWLPTIGRFNKPKWQIELISIGIKCNDGRTYYAISDEFDASACNDWVVKNVLTKLPRKYLYEFPYDNSHVVVPDYGVGIGYKNPVYKSLEQIAIDVAEFTGCWRDQHFWRAPEGIEFYGYYADYDWVCLASLFGAMVNLPKGFPFYCIDLKQMLDELAVRLLENGIGLHSQEGKVRFDSFDDTLHYLKMRTDYPKQANEHSAEFDAEWNERLHIFINGFKK